MFAKTLLVLVLLALVVVAVGYCLESAPYAFEKECQLDCLRAGYPEHQLMIANAGQVCFCIGNDLVIALWEKEN